MMKKLFVSLIVVFVFGSIVSAAPRTSEQALSIAREHLTKCHPSLGLGAPALRSDYVIAAQSDAYYAINSNSGFILVSADDRMPEVLGYSDSGRFCVDSLPPAFRYWLASYDEELQQLNNVATTQSVPSPATTAMHVSEEVVEPLITTQWDQGYPFNKLCPRVYGTTLCPTGCIATAMAQLMRYYAHPTHGTGSNSYTWISSTFTNWGTLSADFGETTYQWDEMLDSYSGSYTTTEADAVATLMYHCGVAVNMQYDYGASGSNAIRAMTAFYTYFGYDEDILSISKDVGTSELLITALVGELKEGCPIYVTGLDPQGTEGHAFLCDGYSSGLFHFNWGWGGVADGYYSLYALNPTELGTGSGFGSYNNQTTFYTGIRPKGQRATGGLLYADNIYMSNNMISIGGETDITMERISNQSFSPFSGECAMAIIRGADTLVLVTRDINHLKYGTDRLSCTWKNVHFPSTLEGEYNMLCCLYRSSDNPAWQVMNMQGGRCVFPIIVNEDYIEVVLPPRGESSLSWVLTTDSILRLMGNMEMPDYSSVATNRAPWYGIRDSVRYLTIGSGITQVGDFAFYQCRNMQAASLPLTLTKIGRSAFYHCSSLPAMEVPFTCKTIGYAAFDGCTALESVTIQMGLRTIEDYAFNNCRNLQTIICDEPVPPTVSAHTFTNVPRSANVIVPVEAESAYREAYGWREFWINGVSPDGQQMATEQVPATIQTVRKEMRNGGLFITLPDGSRSRYTMQGVPVRE